MHPSNAALSAGAPGRAPELPSLEVLDGSRLVEVREWLCETLLAVHEVAPPRRRLAARPVLDRATGRPLLRWRGDAVEVLVPPGALLGLDDAPPCLLADERGSLDAAVPLPIERVAHLQVGELHMRVAWARPTRRVPRPERIRLDPRAGVALAVSLLAHVVALVLVYTVPPRAWALETSFFETHRTSHVDRFIVPREHEPRAPPRPRAFVTLLHDWRGWLVDGVGPRGEERGDPFLEPRPRCAGKTPAPEVYAGHVTASGPRSAAALRRQLARRARGLRGCYRAALEQCIASSGRIVVSLVVTSRGDIRAMLAAAAGSGWRTDPSGCSSAARDRVSALERCVTEAVRSWTLPPASAEQPTRVRLPLIFRFVAERS